MESIPPGTMKMQQQVLRCAQDDNNSRTVELPSVRSGINGFHPGTMKMAPGSSGPPGRGLVAHLSRVHPSTSLRVHPGLFSCVPSGNLAGSLDDEVSTLACRSLKLEERNPMKNDCPVELTDPTRRTFLKATGLAMLAGAVPADAAAGGQPSHTHTTSHESGTAPRSRAEMVNLLQGTD